ncbi:hypothetical protein LTS15_000177 [Exophiala xenobiotica]|nr:hypothetical protein LTS15_000177 [Exophiala xenobiotica]
MSPYLLLNHMKPLIYDVLFAIDDQEGNSDITKSARDELKECLTDTVSGFEHQRLCLQAHKRLHEKKIEVACARMVETLQGELVFLQQLGREVTDQNVDDYNVEVKRLKRKHLKNMVKSMETIENICKQMRNILSKEPASPMARPEQVVQSLVETKPMSNASNPEAISPDVKTPATGISEVGGPVTALEDGVLKVMHPKPASDESTSRASAVQSANKTSSSAINRLNQPRTTSSRVNEGMGGVSIESPVSAHNDASDPDPILSNGTIASTRGRGAGRGADIRGGRKKMSTLLRFKTRMLSKSTKQERGG